ncbi:hypothetical protein RHMOL_Rhmol07G0314100 [Rhododendron molle]|uniref:Uncharacterized protein n=1 Tax=Rhododendron molle TaxID=49168 RepID=A0ACC0N6Q9_RHOML|nr:hypothetical protein RHMOL_Rhmol07G0314100 [Rhododendron molle]
MVSFEYFANEAKQKKEKKMSSSSSSSKKKIILKSSDGETFEVDEAVAIQSEVIRQRIENDCADGVFPLAQRHERCSVQGDRALREARRVGGS